MSNVDIFGFALSTVIPLPPFPLPAAMAARGPLSLAFRAEGGDCAQSSWVPMSRERECELSEEHPTPEFRSFRPWQARAVMRNRNNRLFLSRSSVRLHIPHILPNFWNQRSKTCRCTRANANPKQHMTTPKRIWRSVFR